MNINVNIEDSNNIIELEKLANELLISILIKKLENKDIEWLIKKLEKNEIDI